MTALRRPAVWVTAVLLVLASLGLVFGASHYRLYVVHTGSMSPTIPTGSVVVVERGPVKVGQVISFMSHNELITHRLVAINSNGTYQTKGDGNSTPDFSSVASRMVVGHVVRAPKNLGYWIYWLKQPTGMASLVLILLAALMMLEPPVSTGRHVGRRATEATALRSSKVTTHAKRMKERST